VPNGFFADTVTEHSAHAANSAKHLPLTDVPLGRGFSEQEEANHAAIAVISYNYWTRRFARSPDVLGKTLYVNGVAITIVGVATEGFEGVEGGGSTDFWIPLQSRPELNAWGNPPEDGKTYIANSTWWCLRLIGRLTPGVTRAHALAQLQPAFQRAAYIALGTPKKGEMPPVLSLADAKSLPGYNKRYGNPLRVLMAMVGACALDRADKRRHAARSAECG
jgi:hypothetical protein